MNKNAQHGFIRCSRGGKTQINQIRITEVKNRLPHVIHCNIVAVNITESTFNIYYTTLVSYHTNRCVIHHSSLAINRNYYKLWVKIVQLVPFFALTIPFTLHGMALHTQQHEFYFLTVISMLFCKIKVSR